MLIAIIAGNKIAKGKGYRIEAKYSSVLVQFTILSVFQFLYVLGSVGATYRKKEEGRTLFLQLNLSSVVFKLFIILFAFFFTIKLPGLTFLFIVLLMLNIVAIAGYVYFGMMNMPSKEKMMIPAIVSAVCIPIAIILLILYSLTLSRAAIKPVQERMSIMYPGFNSYNYMQLCLGEQRAFEVRSKKTTSRPWSPQKA